MSLRQMFAHDSLFWRRFASLGARHTPEWWVRYSPPFFGVAAAVVVPSARRAILGNLRRIRGEASLVRDGIDVARTFASYAGVLAEVLATGSKNGSELPTAEIDGDRYIEEALSHGRGAVVVTVHSGGWEAAGPLLAHRISHAHPRAENDNSRYRSNAADKSKVSPKVTIVMSRERDDSARKIHDSARELRGVRVIHVGDDPLASLPLLNQLGEGGIVALQLDRSASTSRVRSTSILGAPAYLPEGPFRLAQAARSPLVVVFAVRTGYKKYRIEVKPPIFLSRRATEEEITSAVDSVAALVTEFLRRNPTQWFDFHGRAFLAG